MTDVLVCAHSSCIDLLCASISVRAEDLLLLRCSLNDSGKLLFLCIEVRASYCDLLLHDLELILLVEDALLCLCDVLLSNLTKKVYVLDLLVERVELTAVSYLLELALILFDLIIAL